MWRDFSENLAVPIVVFRKQKRGWRKNMKHESIMEGKDCEKITLACLKPSCFIRKSGFRFYIWNAIKRLCGEIYWNVSTIFLYIFRIFSGRLKEEIENCLEIRLVWSLTFWTFLWLARTFLVISSIYMHEKCRFILRLFE